MSRSLSRVALFVLALSALVLAPPEARAQATLLADIGTGSVAGPQFMGEADGKVYFDADDGTNGRELWEYDPATGAVTLIDIFPSGASNPQYPVEVGGRLYFSGRDATAGQELLVLDPATRSVSVAADIWSGGIGSSPRYLTAVGSVIYFAANDGAHGEELWRYDTATGAASLAANIAPGGGSSTVRYITQAGGRLYFAATDGVSGYEPWQYDLATGSASLVADIRGGSSGSNPSFFLGVGGTVYFQAYSTTNGAAVWAYAPGTGLSLASDPHPTTNFSPRPEYLEEVGGVIYFYGNDGANGYELWFYDPATGTDGIAADISPGSGSSSPRDLTEIGGVLYFRATGPEGAGQELWRYDPASGAAELVADIGPNQATNLAAFHTLDGALYFRADDGTSGQELWRYTPPPPPEASLVGADGYRMLADPAGGTVGDLFGGMWTEGFSGADDPTSGFCSVLTWDETAADFASGYACASGASAPVPAGTGVLAYVWADDDRTSPGTVEGGFPKVLVPSGAGVAATFDAFPITYTEVATAPAYQQGWNLLGNPLGVAFDWDGALRTGALGATVYVYDPGYLGGAYRSWTAGVGGDLPSGLVSELQGFFVKANGPGASMTVLPAAFGAGATDPGVYGKGASGERPEPLRVELRVDAGGGDEAASVAFVASAPEAAVGLDPYDAYRLGSGAWPRAAVATWPLGTPEAEAAPLALNALPVAVAGETRVPLTVSAEGYAAGPLALTLAWDGALPEGWTAALLDHETGARTEVAPGETYRFTADVSADVVPGEAGGSLWRTPTLPAAPVPARQADTAYDSGDRFELVLNPARVVAAEETPEAFALGALAPNPTRGTASVEVTLAEAGEATVSVFDATGRLVGQRRQMVAAGSQRVAVPARGLAPGVYAVRVSAPGGVGSARMTVVR